MTEFGKALFGGSRFIFWTLTPAILIFLITTPFLIPEWNPSIIGMVVSFWIIGLSLILGMLNPSRFGWSFRITSGMVFMAYVAYFISEMIEHNWKLSMPGSRAEANPVNAMLGLIIIGGPALVYTLLGRFTFREQYDILDDEEMEDSQQPDSGD